MLLNPQLSITSVVPAIEYTVMVGVGKVSADLTDFPLMIDLADMPPSFWSQVNSTGSNIRAYAPNGVTVIPHDVTFVDKTRSLGRMFAKKTLLTASNNVVIIKVLDMGTPALAVTDPNGRNAMWSDYQVVLVYPDTVNRTGNVYTRAANEVAFSSWKRQDYYDMPGDPHQGLAVDGSGNLVTIDTNYLRRATIAAPTTVLASNADPITVIRASTGDVLVNHLSDGCIIAGELWVPANEYPNTGGVYNEYFCVFNLTTLALDRTYNVSAVGRHISSIAQDPDTGIIWATDYTNGATLMQFNTSGTYLGTVALSATINDLQGITFVEGSIFLSSDDFDITKVSKTGVIDVGIGNEYHNPQSGISEGISYDSVTKKLFHMDGDGDMSVLERIASLADWGRLHYECHFETYPRSTVWSMGASIYWLDTTGDLQQGFLSMANETTNTQRATVAYRTSSNRLAIWNSTDSWLESDVDLAYKDRFRVSAKHDGTTERKLFHNGVLKATDATISARPAGSGTDMNFVVNASDITSTEDGEGYYQFVWARNQYLTDAWMAADGENNQTPSTFYSIT